MDLNFLFGPQSATESKGERGSINPGVEQADSIMPFVAVTVAFILAVAVLSYVIVVLVNKIKTTWERRVFGWIKKKLLETSAYFFIFMWIGTIAVGVVWPIYDSVVNKGENIDVMKEVQKVYTYLLSEDFIYVLGNLGFALAFCMVILFAGTVLTYLATVFVLGSSAVAGGSVVWSILAGSQELNWESIVYTVLIVLVFALVLVLFNSKIKPALNGISSGSSLVISHIHYILPVVLCATVIFGTQLGIILSITSNLTGSKMRIFPLIFLLSWSWNSLHYFVKVFTASVLEISRSREAPSKKGVQSGIFMDALRRTFSAFKFIFYFSFFPAFFDLLIFILDTIIDTYKSAKRVARSHYITEGIFKVIGVPMDWVIIPILNFVKVALSQVKKALEYSIEFSLVRVGMGFDESKIDGLSFRELKIANMRGLLLLMISSVFRYIFHFGPVLIFTVISLIFRGRATLIALLSGGNMGILSNFIGSFFGPVTKVFSLMGIGNSGALIAYAACVFIIVAIMGSVFSALVYELVEEEKEEEQRNSTGSNIAVGEKANGNIKSTKATTPLQEERKSPTTQGNVVRVRRGPGSRG